ncbi:hypothetical protein KNE206_63660 [Kitasatospora sp. NE20-6]
MEADLRPARLHLHLARRRRGLLVVGGSYGGPFPADGLIPLLKPLADYGWAVGVSSSLAIYTLSSIGSRSRTVA